MAGIVAIGTIATYRTGTYRTGLVTATAALGREEPEGEQAQDERADLFFHPSSVRRLDVKVSNELEPK